MPRVTSSGGRTNKIRTFFSFLFYHQTLALTVQTLEIGIDRGPACGIVSNCRVGRAVGGHGLFGACVVDGRTDEVEFSVRLHGHDA